MSSVLVLCARAPEVLLCVYVCMLSTVAAPQLTSVVLTSFKNGTFELVLQYDQQVCMHMKEQHALGHFIADVPGPRKEIETDSLYYNIAANNGITNLLCSDCKAECESFSSSLSK